MPTEAWGTPAVHHTVSWLGSYEFGQSEECEPSHGPTQAAERESSLKFRLGCRNGCEELYFVTRGESDTF